MTEGKKFDTGKNKLGLLDPFFLWEMGQNLSHGAKQYGEANWQDVDNPERRYTDALLRHLYSYLAGNDNDAETGFSELAMVATNAMFLYHFQNTAEGYTQELAAPCRCERCNDAAFVPQTPIVQGNRYRERVNW